MKQNLGFFRDAKKNRRRRGAERTRHLTERALGTLQRWFKLPWKIDTAKNTGGVRERSPPHYSEE